mmetsp:Transcript_80647/g.224442  ORF Transcript_80647/g.224442 Transcript_80647/m.224442 type:complete len:234 (-) Transcript_80647:151-852(-)
MLTKPCREDFLLRKYREPVRDGRPHWCISISLGLLQRARKRFLGDDRGPGLAPPGASLEEEAHADDDENIEAENARPKQPNDRRPRPRCLVGRAVLGRSDGHRRLHWRVERSLHEARDARVCRGNHWSGRSPSSCGGPASAGSRVGCGGHGGGNDACGALVSTLGLLLHPVWAGAVACKWLRIAGRWSRGAATHRRRLRRPWRRGLCSWRADGGLQHRIHDLDDVQHFVADPN